MTEFYIFSIIRIVFCPCSLTDKTSPSEGENAGSIPAEGTWKIMKIATNCELYFDFTTK